MKHEFDFSKARRGPLIPRDPRKTRITIWLDTKLVDYLQSIVDRAGGGSWEDFLNELLSQRVLSSGREVRGIKSRSSKIDGAQDRLSAALRILDTGENFGNHSGRSHSAERTAKRVQKNKKTHGGKAVRLLDFEP